MAISESHGLVSFEAYETDSCRWKTIVMHSIRCHKLRNFGLTKAGSPACPGPSGRTSPESPKTVIHIVSNTILPDVCSIAWPESQTHRTSSRDNKLLAHLP